MKNQYFGDINDYRKYGLLRIILQASNIHLFVAWMLTADDGSSDGKFVKYLSDPDKWAGYDPILFNTLKDLLIPDQKRRVSLLESTDLLLNTHYFSDFAPDSAEERDLWFISLCEQAKKYDFVFLDPDNGIEVKSKPYGRKDSSKFLFYREIAELWESGKSLLIYQHFIRENRNKFIQRMVESLGKVTTGSIVKAITTSHVLFLIALQPKHQGSLDSIVSQIQKNWTDQISYREPVLNNGEGSFDKYQELSDKQKEHFLSMAGYSYKGNELKGSFKTDRPYNKKWAYSPWTFSFQFDLDNGNLFCELSHRMTNNRTEGWSYDGNPLQSDVIETVYQTYYL